MVYNYIPPDQYKYMFTIPSQYTSFKYVRPISWEKIFSIWRELEAWQESWQKHWTERGFDSWDEWREAYARPLRPETLSWELFSVSDPLRDFPSLYGTPTDGWIKKAYNGKITKQLKELSKLPIVRDNEKILDLKKHFPAETMLTGLIHNDTIVLIEGMHRANALANWNPNTPFTGTVTIALAEWNEPIPAIGGNYKNK